MHTVLSCPLCDSPIRSRPAVVAPFLASRIWKRRPFGVELAECGRCAFRFYNPRLDPEEESRLYAEYREPAYQRNRQAAEPWYSERLNDSIDSPETIATRREAVTKVLQQYIARHGFRRVLDFGGGRGHLIKDLVPGAEGAVYDISGVEPISGIRAVSSLDECRELNFDLIFCSNVLEHVGSPRAIAGQIREITGPDGLAFIEVPFESPFDGATLLKRVAQFGILCLTRPATALSLLRPGMFYWMHEHINYFTLAALEGLMNTGGWNVVASGVYDCKQPSGFSRVVWCLARTVAD